MSSDYIEQLGFKITAEASQADATIESLGKKMMEFAKLANVPVQTFIDAISDMKGVEEKYLDLIRGAVDYAKALEIVAKAQEKVRLASPEQQKAEAQVGASDAAYAQRIANQERERKLAEQRALAFGKQAEEVNKLDAELKQLDARLKNGTATIKEYSAALANMIKPSTMAATKAISPNLFSQESVAQVKDTMMEIQAITKLEAGKVAAIMRTMFPNIDTRNIDAAKKALQGIEPVAKKAGQGLLSFSNFLRTAFGTMTAMLIFKTGQAISNFFTGTLKAASDFRAAMLEINLAESFLSKKGMEITLSDFDDAIAQLEEKYKYLSKLEVASLVGEVAGAAVEFDFTPEQIFKVSDALAYVNTKLKLSGKEAVDAAHFMNALMDSRSNFFNGMGLNITEQLVKEKAVAMGLAKQGEELDKNVRLQASMALITEQTSSKQEELNRQLEGTPMGQQIALQKEWSDAALSVGKAFITVRDNLVSILASASPELADKVVQFFVKAAENVNVFIDSLDGAVEAWKIIDATLSTSQPTLYKINHGLMDLTNPFTLLIGLAKTLYSGLLGISTIFATVGAFVITFLAEVRYFGIQEAFTDAGKNSAAAWKAGWENEFKVWNSGTPISADNIHTAVPLPAWADGAPTGDKKETKDTEINEDLQKALEKMNQEILEAQLKLEQDMEDAAIDLGRKMEDITIEYEQKRADAYRDYSSKIADINRSYSNKIADINAKAAESRAKAQADQLEKEREFQNKLQEMREEFLMDMDDALHARDARQILKLIKQYELEKLQAERKHALDMESAAKDEELRQKSFANERAAAERDRKAKLAEAQQDYADKLAKLAADEQAERDAAQLKYTRELEDLNKQMQDRFEIIAANLVNEFNLTEAHLKDIVALYSFYYGQASQIMAAMQHMLAGAQVLSSKPYPIVTGVQTGGSLSGDKQGGMAQGGTIIADQPTSVIFGEAGIEAATFTPINRTGADVNKLFSNMSGGGGGAGGGNVGIEILLSPDLEARIVSNTLSKTGQVFTKVQRSKR